jgi:hypothetical protein
MVQEFCVGRRKPHGVEWQRYFHQVLSPVLHPGVFQPHTILALQNHIRNPRATTHCDPELHTILMGQESLPQLEEGELLARDLEKGDCFSLKDKQFEVLEKKRSRVWINDLKSGLSYSVPFMVKVKRITREEARNAKPTHVGQLNPGDTFFMGSTEYRVEEQKRTWALCREVKTNRWYEVRKDFPL